MQLAPGSDWVDQKMSWRTATVKWKGRGKAYISVESWCLRVKYWPSLPTIQSSTDTLLQRRMYCLTVKTNPDSSINIYISTNCQRPLPPTSILYICLIRQTNKIEKEVVEKENGKTTMTQTVNCRWRIDWRSTNLNWCKKMVCEDTQCRAHKNYLLKIFSCHVGWS